MVEQKIDFEEIPPHRRELYLRILNDLTDFHPVTRRLHYLNDHFPLPKLDLALKWLIDSGFIGKVFMGWFKTVCQSSDLEMARILNSVVDNAFAGRLIAGKNFRT